jgi:hypothetical protein
MQGHELKAENTSFSKNSVFWDIAPCRSCVNRRFGGTYRLHLQSRRIRGFPQDVYSATSQKTVFSHRAVNLKSYTCFSVHLSHALLYLRVSAIIQSVIYYDITSYSLLKISWRFGGICRLHFQNKSTKKRGWYLFHAGFLLGLFFESENRINMFVRNVYLLSTD